MSRDHANGEQAGATGEGVILDYLAARERKDLGRVATLWSEDGVIEYPFSPTELAGVVPRKIEGGERIVARLESVLPLGKEIRCWVDRLRALKEEGSFLLEYHERSVMTSGKIFEASFCAIVELRDGKLLRWREFFDPDVVRGSFGAGA